MRVFISIAFVIALATWSAGPVSAQPAPVVVPQHAGSPAIGLSQTVTEGVLHNFGSGADGSRPKGDLIEVSGVLYGTTCNGGKYGSGSMFAITTAGSERVLYSFRNRPDGACPHAGLIEQHGVFYGTTIEGGEYHEGTVFAVTLAGTERVLHSFGNGADGETPYGGLVGVDGVLYGTTGGGGTYKTAFPG